MKIVWLDQSLIICKKTEGSVANRTYEMITHTGENLNCHSEKLSSAVNLFIY